MKSLVHTLVGCAAGVFIIAASAMDATAACHEVEATVEGTLSLDAPIAAETIQPSIVTLDSFSKDPDRVVKRLLFVRTGERQWSVSFAQGPASDKVHDFGKPALSIQFDDEGNSLATNDFLVAEVPAAGEAYAVYQVRFGGLRLSSGSSRPTLHVMGKRPRSCEPIYRVDSIKTKADQVRDELNPINYDLEPELAVDYKRGILGPR